jgi:hypothetical protein
MKLVSPLQEGIMSDKLNRVSAANEVAEESPRRGLMKHTLALLLTVLGLAACSDTISPRPDKSSAVPSFDVAQDGATAIPGDAAVGDLAATADAPAAAKKPGSGSGSNRSVVLPNAYTDVMGESANTFPHAQANMRYQQVFLGPELQGIRAVGGLCLRRDEDAGGPAQTQQLTVKLGPTVLNHTNLTPVYDANYAAPPTTVFSGAVNIPQHLGGGTPDDFYICIDFTTNYIHPEGFNVIVEIVNTSATSMEHFADRCGPSAGCTTRRVFGFPATATVGVTDAVAIGLIMKFSRGNPSTKEDCKNGGWKNYGFKNQGQCIRFVETGQDNR